MKDFLLRSGASAAGVLHGFDPGTRDFWVANVSYAMLPER